MAAALGVKEAGYSIDIITRMMSDAELLAIGDITALVALQDQSVIGLLKATRARGLRVPDDVSIVGMVSGPMAA